MKESKPIEIEEAQVEQLIHKAEQGRLDAAEQRQLVPLLKTLLWLQRTLLSTRISLAKLQRILFGKKTEKSRHKPKDPHEGESGGGNGSGGPGGSGSGGGEYPAGGNGPSARASDGPPNDSYGAWAVASMPPQAGTERYATSLKVNLAVAHYHLGLPLKRIESFQNLLDMPLSDATQWEVVEEVADSACPVYERLKSLGARQPLVYQDDTGARILSLIKENQSEPAPKRQGMYTTALQFEGEHVICVYFTGRCHVGENLDAVLALRKPSPPPIQWMSDGLAANTPKQHKN